MLTFTLNKICFIVTENMKNGELLKQKCVSFTAPTPTVLFYLKFFIWA